MKILVTGSIAYDVLLQYDGSFKDALKGSDLEKLSVSFFSPTTPVTTAARRATSHGICGC